MQTPEVIEKMRVAGRIAAGALAEAGKAVAPGVTTDAPDRIAHAYPVDHGAYPSTPGYQGFPKSCCPSPGVRPMNAVTWPSPRQAARSVALNWYRYDAD